MRLPLVMTTGAKRISPIPFVKVGHASYYFPASIICPAVAAGFAARFLFRAEHSLDNRVMRWARR